MSIKAIIANLIAYLVFTPMTVFAVECDVSLSKITVKRDHKSPLEYQIGNLLSHFGYGNLGLVPARRNSHNFTDNAINSLLDLWETQITEIQEMYSQDQPITLITQEVDSFLEAVLSSFNSKNRLRLLTEQYGFLEARPNFSQLHRAIQILSELYNPQSLSFSQILHNSKIIEKLENVLKILFQQMAIQVQTQVQYSLIESLPKESDFIPQTYSKSPVSELKEQALITAQEQINSSRDIFESERIPLLNQLDEAMTAYHAAKLKSNKKDLTSSQRQVRFSVQKLFKFIQEHPGQTMESYYISIREISIRLHENFRLETSKLTDGTQKNVLTAMHVIILTAKKSLSPSDFSKLSKRIHKSKFMAPFIKELTHNLR